MMVRNCIVVTLLLALQAGDLLATAAESEHTGLNEAATLPHLVETFFRTTSANERTSLIASIEQAAHGNVAHVAAVVAEVKLWLPLHDRQGFFPLKTATAGTIEVAFRLPPDYDPAHRYPMLVCMPNVTPSPQQPLMSVNETLGASIQDFVLLSPAQPVGGLFHQPSEAARDLRDLLREARRRIHIDPDRVFLFGENSGGDRAWIAALMHPDLFVGAVVLASYPPIPYAEQVYPFLLENLRSLAVLSLWESPDHANASLRQKAVATHNRAIVALAKRSSWPIIGIEVSSDGSAGLKPPQAELATLFQRRKKRLPHRLSHWFRYPAQGHVGWLSQAAFKGNVWEALQLSILASPATDRNTYIADVVKEKMAYLGGVVEGQTIKIQARRCARIDLLLPEGLVDVRRPVTVLCNGRKRHEGLMIPSIRTLLESAYEQWAFTRLPVARLSFSVKKP